MLGASLCFWEGAGFKSRAHLLFMAFSLILLLPGGKLSVHIFGGRFCLFPESVNLFS